jgi:hypothetical protein
MHHFKQSLISFLIVVIAGCGGGLNSSNADAPAVNQPHYASWISYHRDDPAEGVITTNPAKYHLPNGLPAPIDQIVIEENVTRCRVCHGPNLTGPLEGYKGYACLNCHVLDPVKFPVMCFSCHGGWPVVPTQTLYADVTFVNSLRDSGAWPVSPLHQWFSTARIKRPNIPMFSPALITQGKHLKHKAIPFLPYDATLNDNQLTENSECNVCHGTPSDIGTKHHALLNKPPPPPYSVYLNGQPVWPNSCLIPLTASGGGCHSFVTAPGGGFAIVTDCKVCHSVP